MSIFTPEFGQFVKLDISGAAGKPKLRSGNAQRSIGPDTFVPLKPNQIRQIDLPDLHDYYYSGLDKEGSFRLSYAYTGRKPPRDQVLVAPSGVIARQSTDVAAVSDPELHEVLRFIREHLGEPFSIDELLRAVSVSRRWLEYHFRERFGRSPHAYVSERRVERAKGLLLAPRSPPLEQIAEACGFSTVRSLAETFRRVTGMTPVEFQSANRAGK